MSIISAISGAFISARVVGRGQPGVAADAAVGAEPRSLRIDLGAALDRRGDALDQRRRAPVADRVDVGALLHQLLDELGLLVAPHEPVERAQPELVLVVDVVLVRLPQEFCEALARRLLERRLLEHVDEVGADHAVLKVLLVVAADAENGEDGEHLSGSRRHGAARTATVAAGSYGDRAARTHDATA